MLNNFTSSNISAAVNLASFFVIAVGLFYTARQIKLLIKIHQENHDWNRRVAAQSALVAIRELTETIQQIEAVFQHGNTNNVIALSIIKEKIESNKKLRPQIARYLSSYESLARGILQGIYDEEVVMTGRRGQMTKVFNQFYHYIDLRRKTINKNYCSCMEDVVKRWKSKDVKVKQRSAIGRD